MKQAASRSIETMANVRIEGLRSKIWKACPPAARAATPNVVHTMTISAVQAHRTNASSTRSTRSAIKRK